MRRALRSGIQRSGAVALLMVLSACGPDAVADGPKADAQTAQPRSRSVPAPPLPPRGAEPAESRALRVRQVIDGDTITISGIGTVRLIGVDAPEKTGGYRESEPYGDAATRYLKQLIEGKLVTIEYDGDRKDQYNRTLAYVFLEDGSCVNEAIIRAGWAETYRRFDYQRKPDFQAAERDARAARRGIWQR